MYLHDGDVRSHIECELEPHYRSRTIVANASKTKTPAYMVRNTKAHGYSDRPKKTDDMATMLM